MSYIDMIGIIFNYISYSLLSYAYKLNDIYLYIYIYEYTCAHTR